MPMIKIGIGCEVRTLTNFLRIDYYKSKEAFLNPLEHPNDSFNCVHTIDLGNIHKPDQFSIIKNLLNNIETSVNELLNNKEIKQSLE